MKLTYIPANPFHGAYIDLHMHRDYNLRYTATPEQLEYFQGYNYVNGSKLPNHYRCYKPDKIPIKYKTLYEKCKELYHSTFKDKFNVRTELEIEI